MTFMDADVFRLQELVMHEQPRDADAIIWLQGNMYDRGEKVLELYHGGYAPSVLVTGNTTRRVDDDLIIVHDCVRWLCLHGVPRDTIICDDTALHTALQAHNSIAIARTRAWQTLLLVASPHHQLRAFLTFLQHARLQAWSGRIINQPVNIDWDTAPSGRRKVSREAFVDEVRKLDVYTNDVASIAEGIRYLMAL
jgi:hypothetical protein